MKNDYFKTIDELSKIYKTVSSVQNLSFLQQYASLLEPVTKSIDIASLSQQLTSVSTLFSDTASIQDRISASKSLVDVLPHLDGITSSVNLKGAFSKEEVQSLMDGITFQNEHVKINSSATHTLESVPDSVPLEDNKQLQQTVDSSQNTENVAVSFRNDSVVVLKNKDFVNVYGKPLAQWFLSNFQTCRAACPPYVVPAFRHKQYMNLSSLWFLLSSLCAILSVRTTVHYRARRGEWRKTILSRKLICAVIPF